MNDKLMSPAKIRLALEAHAKMCREALSKMRPRPEMPAKLSGADLRYSNLSGANLIGADLIGADLRFSILSGADLSYSKLSGADLRYSILSGANLRYSNLSGADLRNADLSYSILRDSNLRYSNLSDTNLSGADLSGADLSYSILRDAILSYSILSGADLSGADLSGADLPTGYRIASICFGGWPVTVTHETTTIGCQSRPNASWLAWAADAPEIAEMHEKAPAWWARHREAVCAVIRDVMTPHFGD